MTERFAFGKNWRRYLSELDEARIASAVEGLQISLGRERLEGSSFLDIGCGSGVHSLAAFRMAAARVFSFDYDSEAVACTKELRRRAGNPRGWHVTNGSVLDAAFLA